MKVVYDAQSKPVIVNLRGRVQVLPETFDSEAAAVLAGEQFCLSHGWRPPAPDDQTALIRSPWGR